MVFICGALNAIRRCFRAKNLGVTSFRPIILILIYQKLFAGQNKFNTLMLYFDVFIYINCFINGI